MKEIKGYKGFDKDLTCRGYQYKVDGDFEEKEPIECCDKGFHLCENPMDVFNYYSPSDSRYCEVKGSGQMDKNNDGDSKVAVSKLHVGVEIGLKGIIEAGVKFIFDRVNWSEDKKSNDKDRSAATNTGYRSAASNTGNQSAATNTGYQSAATNTGYQSAATNTGDQSAATNTGYQSAATNTGNQSAASVEGKESIAIATGIEGKAKGALGCWIVVTEWLRDEECNWHIKDVKSIKVDGEKIKADTYYMLKDGEFTKCEED